MNPFPVNLFILCSSIVDLILTYIVIDNSLDKSRLIDPYRTGLRHSGWACADCIERCWQGEACPAARAKAFEEVYIQFYYAM
jgi:hypothetical protein